MFCDLGYFKKGLLLAVPFLFLETAFAENSFSEKHIKPTLQRAGDTTSLNLFLGGAGMTALATSQDHQMKDRWENHQQMSKADAEIGDFLGTGIPGVAMALSQLYLDPENGEAHARALSFTALTTYTLKYSVGRQRPHGGNDRLSFPSGHTSTTFATATSLTYAYGWKAAVVAYPLAIWTGLSRMSDNVHWFSDVVAGATVGVLWGRATYYQSPESSSLLMPMVLPESTGILWVSHF